jgi:hypothetical protein
MPAEKPQDYKSHRRYDFWWHGPAFITLTAGVVVAARHAIKTGAWFDWWATIYAAAVLIAVFKARGQTLTVQNRVIRLEMRLRLKDVLLAPLAARIHELTLSQLVGLRFASDAELPGLVERCLNGTLATGEAVKKEIKDWQPDWVRA